MLTRRFGRTGWQVSEVGYGMWGMGGWTGSDDAESLSSLHRSIELGCTFFDTAWVYGQGRSEKLLGQTIRSHPGARIIVATKIPPKNMRWPARADYTIGETYPADHIREYTEKSLENLGVDVIDLQQFHVWNDAWADDDGWKRAIDDLRTSGLVRAVGISINRWEPANVIRALDTGLIDSVQVVYNIFDQAPEDELFPYCEAHGIAVIARVPFDEGSLTGTLTAGSTLARRRLPEPVFHAGQPDEDPRTRGAAGSARPGRHGIAGDGTPLHPGAHGREHRHSGHAATVARGT